MFSQFRVSNVGSLTTSTYFIRIGVNFRHRIPFAEPFPKVVVVVSDRPVDRLIQMNEPNAPSRATYIALALTATAWLVIGLVQREPWKADEAYSFGLVFSFFETNQWLVPTLAGEPFLEKPPLIFWIAAALARLSGSLVPIHEAARLSNVLIIISTFVMLAIAGSRAFGRVGAGAAVGLLAGAPAFLIFSRDLTADLGLFAGAALVSLGLISLTRQTRDAGVLLGLGASVGLMSKGLLLPGATGLACLILMIVSPIARNRANLRQLAIAFGVFLVLGLAWPMALLIRSPNLFWVWFWDNNFARFIGANRLGPANDRWHTLGIMSLVLLPVWPFAVAAVARSGSSLRNSPIVGPLIFALCWIGLLLASSTSRAGYALPALVPLAIVGAAAIVDIQARERKWLKLVLGWGAIAIVAGIVGAKLFFTYRHPFTVVGAGSFSAATLVLAAAIALAWGLSVRSGAKPSALTLWVAMLTVSFAVAASLFLPGANQKSGFRGVFGELAAHIDRRANCIASRGLGEPERAMLHYYAGIRTRRFEINVANAESCAVWIEQQRAVDDSGQFGCIGAAEVWSGSRPEDHASVFRVCAR